MGAVALAFAPAWVAWVVEVLPWLLRVETLNDDGDEDGSRGIADQACLT